MIAKSRKQMKLLTTSIGEYVKDYLEKNKTLIVTRVCGVGYFVALTALAMMALVAIHKYEDATAKIEILELENRGLKYQIKVIEDENTALTSSYKVMEDSYTDLVEVASELDTENQEVVAAYKEQSEELQKFQEREELYDKYEYALFRDEDNSRTDINYDDIKSLEQLAEEKDMGEDAISLVLNIAKIESDYKANAKNPKSSAAGLCGLVKKTARTIYVSELGSPQGTYKHDPMAYDSNLNLQIGLSLVNYLSEKNNGNVMKVVNSYRGYEDDVYNAKLNRLLKANVNKSLYELQL